MLGIFRKQTEFKKQVESHLEAFEQLAKEMDEIAQRSAELAKGLVVKANGHMPKGVLEGMGLGARGGMNETELADKFRSRLT